MGNCCRIRKSRRKIVLLLVGLDNAGKTRAANGLAGDHLSSPVPTVGFSVITLKYSNYDVKIFDLGGGSNIRAIWHKYFVDAYGLIFVLDSSDFSRFNEAKMVLEDILSSDKISGKPLLVLANKQDNENALDEIDIIEYLDIEQLVNNRKCPTLVQSCTATDNNSNKLDPGIRKGYEWLLNIIEKNYEHLNERVVNDVQEQEKQEKEEFSLRLQRIKNQHKNEERIKNEDAIETYSEYVKKINMETKETAVPFQPQVAFEDIIKSSDSSETTSIISFPSVYLSENTRERPKSAVEIVKYQLQLKPNMRKLSLKSRNNRTAPMNLYGSKLPHSAHETSRVKSTDKRTLRSADDCLFTISKSITNKLDNIGASGDHGIRINNTSDKITLPPLKKKIDKVPWHANNGVMSVVDIE